MNINYVKIFVIVAAVAGFTGCGDNSTFSGEVDSTTTTTTTTSTSTVPDATTVALGSGTGSAFTPGVLGLGLSSLSAGGKTSVTATLVDVNGNMYTEPTSVSFSSTCTGQLLAVLDTPITSVDGFAITNYTATGCSGTDTINALATVDGTTISASATVTIAQAEAGQILFTSAQPSTIGIQGAGLTESSTLTFTVLDTSGDPIANQPVSFTLNTTQGGITLSQASDTSNNGGEVTTVVNSGTVPTSVRVTATLDLDTSIGTQSDRLVISTGLADQNSFSFSAEIFNPEGWDYNGQTVTLSVYAADHYNNPVPDGAVVYFQTEGGQVQPSCELLAGTCSVEWTSANPRPRSDGRATVTATMQGEESFSDTNGNGLLDDGESYNDLAEAFYDYNENGTYEPTFALMDANGEVYYEEPRDFNSNGDHDAADGEYNGVLCNSNNSVITCSSQKSLDARGNLVLVMSGSFAVNAAFGVPTLDASSGTGSTTLMVADVNNQVMPAGTTIAITAKDGLTLLSDGSYTVQSSNAPGGTSYPISVKVDDPSTPGSSLVTVKITTPLGNETPMALDVTW